MEVLKEKSSSRRMFPTAGKRKKGGKIEGLWPALVVTLARFLIHRLWAMKRGLVVDQRYFWLGQESAPNLTEASV